METVNFNDLENDKQLVKLISVPFQMRVDYERRNENITNDKQLCQRCDGTGNRLYSMYHKCEDCNGTGIGADGQNIKEQK